MGLEHSVIANADNDKAKSNYIKLEAPKKVNQYIPDFLQKTVMQELDRIENEIRAHEDAINELKKSYMDHYNFLIRYNPFGTGNLSQKVSLDKGQSPGASAPGREEEHEGKQEPDLITDRET